MFVGFLIELLHGCCVGDWLQFNAFCLHHFYPTRLATIQCLLFILFLPYNIGYNSMPFVYTIFTLQDWLQYNAFCLYHFYPTRLATIQCLLFIPFLPYKIGYNSMPFVYTIFTLQDWLQYNAFCPSTTILIPHYPR